MSSTQMNKELVKGFKFLLSGCVAASLFRPITVNKMTAYQVPDVPAVRVALEHLSELDKRLREEGVLFSQEASLHLREIAEALTELEAYRKTAREKLEVETIETSKLRHQTFILQDDIKSEILSCVSAAREGHTAELTRLRSELKTVIQDIESMEKSQQLLEKENAILLQERENVQGKYGDGIDQLNLQLSEKASKQILLAEKQNEIQSLKEKIVQVQAARQDLEEDTMQKNKTFTENKHTLDSEIGGIEEQIKEQRKINAEARNELDIMTSEVQDKEETITQCKTHISQLEKIITRLTASQTKYKECLDEKIDVIEALNQQKEFLERELVELTEAFEQEVQNLQEQMGAIKEEIEEEQKVGNALVEPVTELSLIVSSQRKEEDDVIEKKQSLSKRLEECKMTHEKHITAAAKCKIEIKNMKKEIEQLRDVNTITADLFKKNLEDLEAQLVKEKMKREPFDAEKEQICQSLKTLKEEHKEHARDLGYAIEQTERRNEELQEEEKKLQDQDVLLSSVIKYLSKELANTEEEGKQLELNFQAEIHQLKTDTESMTQARLEKERELEVQESILEQVNAQFNTDHLRHQALRKQTSELETQKQNLELSIQEVRKQTTALLNPKDELKRELETSRAKHMEMLTVHAAEISTVEKSIYENTVLLEQVNMENSRLHVSIEQMKMEISDAQKDKEQYTQEVEWMREQTPLLFKSLIDAWTADMVLTKESADMEQKIIESIDRLMLKIQERKHDIGDINRRLESELMAMKCTIQTPTQQEEIKHSTTD